MKTVNVPVGKGYCVYIGGGISAELAALLPAVPEKALVVSEAKAYGICGERVCASLRGAGCEVYTYLVPGGEAAKSFEYLEKILISAAGAGLARDGLFVSVGGGSVSDITGLAASLYMRGTPFAAVPTTLLAAADASVGGKNALDIPGGKNLVGTVYQPCVVVCDTDAVTSDMQSAFYPGMSEAIKHGVISGGALFESIKSGGFADDIPSFIAANVELKAKYVAADEKDSGVRRVLNFGHTVGHAVESIGAGQPFPLLHGECVSIGMLAMTEGEVRRRLLHLLHRYDLPTAFRCGREELRAALVHDKKAGADGITTVRVPEIGRFTMQKESTDAIIGSCGEVISFQ